MKIKAHIESEKKTVGMMVRLYCRRYEGNKQLCQDCSQLLSYAEARLDMCKFGNEKPTCKKCPIHCYKPDMREKMRTVKNTSEIGTFKIISHSYENGVWHLRWKVIQN